MRSHHGYLLSHCSLWTGSQVEPGENKVDEQSKLSVAWGRKKGREAWSLCFDAAPTIPDSGIMIWFVRSLTVMQCSMPSGPALSGCKGDNKATRSWQFLKKGYNLRPLLSLLKYFPLPPYERFASLIFLGPPTVAHNCHSKTKHLTQKQNTHDKTENLMAKTKYLTAKPKTSPQKQNTSRKKRNLTAKTKTSRQKQNTSRQKQNLHGKTKAILFLLWSINLFLPWGFCFCREVFGFAVTVVSHHIHQSICYQIVEWKWNFKKHITYESSPFPIK